VAQAPEMTFETPLRKLGWILIRYGFIMSAQTLTEIIFGVTTRKQTDRSSAIMPLMTATATAAVAQRFCGREIHVHPFLLFIEKPARWRVFCIFSAVFCKIRITAEGSLFL
jgi:hypothetical protein